MLLQLVQRATNFPAKRASGAGFHLGKHRAAPASAIAPSARAIARSVMPGLPLSSRSFAIASAGASAGSKPASSSFASSGSISDE